jgi:hypothetical protein
MIRKWRRRYKRTISYGAGVQSTALVVLATLGEIEADCAVFANTGDDSEHPASLAFLRQVAIPWAAERGFEIIEVARTYADGRPYRTLLQHMTETMSVPIPVRMSGGVPASRTCTAEWKGRTLDKWRKQNGATPDEPMTSLIGFSTDEYKRMNNKRASPLEVIEYPLIDLGLSRNDCLNIITKAGLPIPRKSSCWFCPWKPVSAWRAMKVDEPELFRRGVELEQMLTARTEKLTSAMGGPVYMTNALRHLPEITEGEQHQMFPDSTFNDGECDSGVCWT